MAKQKHPPGEPMTLGNMRQLGVHRLVASCLKDACRHQGLIDVSKYPDDTEVPSFASKIVCAKCGARGRHIRRAAELEGTIDARKPHGQGLALSSVVRTKR
jgi:hypothetical protein